MRAVLVGLALVFLPNTLLADLSDTRFQACSQAISSLIRHGQFMSGKLRSGFQSCRVVRQKEATCNWDDPAPTSSNASCYRCAELVNNQQNWLTMLGEMQDRVRMSCGYSIGLSVAGG